jgi:hypothetical protein
MSKVNVVPGISHQLKIPEEATFQTKIGQCSMMPPQQKYLNEKVDEMLAAGIIAPIHPWDVCNVAPTVLAQKAHKGNGLTLDELKHHVNDKCVKHGIPSAFDMPPRPEPMETPAEIHPSQKWCICQDFNNLNKVTQIAPMPQGDIWAKQLHLSGYCYIHIFDFAAGFYAILIHPDSQPYIVFYVEGRGYLKYLQMPFGVTGGPSEFGNLTTQRIHDLITDGIIKMFVDNGGSAANTFEQGLANLQLILKRVHHEKLSLALSKLMLFMTEAMFAGAVIGPNGVSPDSTKLTAIVNWPQPEDASHLEGFLGLTGHFQDLVKGYAKLEKPLQDILRGVDMPKGTRKKRYQKVMKAYKLKDLWTKDHLEAFIRLKSILISEPVLRPPCFNSTPFILTTDGLKDAFTGVLSQKITTTLVGGEKVMCLHPLGFASKQTSTTEEKYKPFLLEFALLKFCFDKFADILWRMPVEVETDCQALWDVLLSDKLNATYARWWDGVLMYNIIDIRHIPGITNIADGISRQYEGTPKGLGDGSEWTVSLDIDKATGVVQNLFQVEILAEVASL